MTTSTEPVQRQAASSAVNDLGWRYLYASLGAAVRVASPTEALELIARLVEALGPDFDEHLRVDLRPGCVELVLATREVGNVTARDVELAGAVTAAVRNLGLTVEPGSVRGVQTFEIAIDALDIPRIRPFWKAVLGYVDDRQGGEPANALIDPLWQSPSIWFQQMDEPRRQRNRIHFDISVAHDEAEARLAAALAAGGALVSDAEAPSFWVLADPEGNEICICTWQGRD